MRWPGRRGSRARGERRGAYVTVLLRYRHRSADRPRTSFPAVATAVRSAPVTGPENCPQACSYPGEPFEKADNFTHRLPKSDRGRDAVG